MHTRSPEVFRLLLQEAEKYIGEAADDDIGLTATFGELKSLCQDVADITFRQRGRRAQPLSLPAITSDPCGLAVSPARAAEEAEA